MRNMPLVLPALTKHYVPSLRCVLGNEEAALHELFERRQAHSRPPRLVVRTELGMVRVEDAGLHFESTSNFRGRDERADDRANHEKMDGLIASGIRK